LVGPERIVTIDHDTGDKLRVTWSRGGASSNNDSIISGADHAFINGVPSPEAVNDGLIAGIAVGSGKDNLKIALNRIQGNRGYGIYANNTEGMYIDNLIINPTLDGVHIVGPGSQVQGNYIEGAKRNPINVLNARDASITDNVMKSVVGLKVHSFHNWLPDSQMALIRIGSESASDTCINILVDNNNTIESHVNTRLAINVPYFLYVTGENTEDIKVGQGNKCSSCDTFIGGPKRTMALVDFPYYERDINGKVVIAYVDTTMTVAEIDATIDTVAAYGGGTVYARPGLYVLPNNDRIDLESGVIFEGINMGDDVAEFRVPSNGENSVFYINGKNDITIRNIFMDANVANQTDNLSYGIEIANTCERITIEKCRFQKASHGIRMAANADITEFKILNNRFVTQTQNVSANNYAIFTPTDVTAVWGAEIRGNKINGKFGSPDTNNAGGGAAIYWAGPYAKITNNTINGYNTANRGGIGVLLHPQAHHTVVSSNTFYDVNGDNISVRAEHCVIEENTISQSGDQGIVVEDTDWAVVSNNAIDSCLTAGIRLLNASHIELNGNTVRKSGYATNRPQKPDVKLIRRALISLSNRSDTDPDDELISDIVLSDNILFSDSTGTLYGIGSI
jgi:parallel beta-helix repeat protein